jgi:hypothetical protein
MVRSPGSSLRIRGSLALTSVIFRVSCCRPKARSYELTLKTMVNPLEFVPNCPLIGHVVLGRLHFSGYGVFRLPLTNELPQP